MLNKLIYTAFFLSQLSRVPVATGTRPDYGKLFGDDWKKAETYVSENRYWMEPLLKKNNIPWHVAMAVVFPELIRYSALRDKIEITLLKALYINHGDEYANFSVGRFQIKPSFASVIRSEAPSVLCGSSGLSFPQPEEASSISDYRKSIIADLEDPAREFSYVVAFIKLCEKKFDTAGTDERMLVRFLATAYNYGIDRKRSEIESMIDAKCFSTKVINTASYCYSDISLFWYETRSH